MAPAGPAGLLERYGLAAARRSLDPDALPVRAAYRQMGVGGTPAELATAAPDTEAGMAEGGDGREPAPKGAAPEPGEAEDPSAPAPVLPGGAGCAARR